MERLIRTLHFRSVKIHKNFLYWSLSISIELSRLVYNVPSHLNKLILA